MRKMWKRILSALLICSTFSTSMMTWPEEASAGQEKLSQTALKTADLGAEALKFYTAVASVSYWECYRSQDPTRCQNFLESLEDPATHIGFVLFVLGSRGTSAGLFKLSRGKYSGPYLGTIAGMMANDLFSELYTSPLFKEFLHLNSKKYSSFEARLERRQELASQLFGETLAQKKWWLDRIPSMVSLTGAAALSSLILPATAAGLGEAEDVSRALLKNERAAEAIAKIRKGIGAYRLAVRSGASVFRIFEMRNPWAFLAGQVGEMVVFLNFSDWIEHPARKWWNETRSVHALNSAISSLRLKSEMVSASGKVDLSQFEERVREVERGWDTYRESQFIDPRKIQGEYLGVTSAMNVELRDYYLDYQWIMAGAPSDPEKVPEWQGSVPDGWEVNEFGHPVSEHAFKARRNFFCGEDPQNAAKAALHFHGVLVPGRGDRVEPFRVATSAGKLVDKPVGKNDDLCAPIFNYGSGYELMMDFKRAEVLKSRSFEVELDAAFWQAFQGLARIQSGIVSRYESRIRRSLVDALNGTEQGTPRDTVSVNRSNYFRGVLPSYRQELEYWRDFGRDFPALRSLADAAMDRTQRKSDAADALLNYLSNPTSARKSAILASGVFQAGDDVGLFEDESSATSEDWQKIVQIWKAFMLGPTGRF